MGGVELGAAPPEGDVAQAESLSAVVVIGRLVCVFANSEEIIEGDDTEIANGACVLVCGRQSTGKDVLGDAYRNGKFGLDGGISAAIRLKLPLEASVEWVWR